MLECIPAFPIIFYMAIQRCAEAGKSERIEPRRDFAWRLPGDKPLQNFSAVCFP